MHMIMLVLDDPNHLEDVMQAWRCLGIIGAMLLLYSRGIVG
ncbi:MAG TPA: hypothetical protein VJ714_05685 [Anaerolineae bacterium]|jgi:hypothetical protein|nr:hypothetical protein [Anaerolineae bacterium]